MTRRPLAAGLLLLAAVLSGCSAPTVHLTPAEHANDPSCADVSVRLPDALGDVPRRWTDAQATAAWGDDSEVVFTCGLEPPGPTTLQCVTIGGVDWIVDDERFPRLVMTTYGRSPAARVSVDTEALSSNDVLQALSSSAQQLPQTGGACVDADELEPDPSAS